MEPLYGRHRLPSTGRNDGSARQLLRYRLYRHQDGIRHGRLRRDPGRTREHAPSCRRCSRIPVAAAIGVDAAISKAGAAGYAGKRPATEAREHVRRLLIHRRENLNLLSNLR